MPEIPLELEHVRTRLRADFTGRLPEATSGTTGEKEVNFLSRALAAYAIFKMSGCTLDEAAASVVDGGGDGGIDAIHFAPGPQILWVAQSKFHQDGSGQPELGDAGKFRNGLDYLLRADFAAFAADPNWNTNVAWQSKLPILRSILGGFNSGVQIRAILVYTGLSVVADDRRALFEALRARYQARPDYLQWASYNLTTVHDWATGADLHPGVESVDLTLYKPGWVTEPYETLYGQVLLADLAALYQTHGRQLITANIRAYKGTTEVNDGIVSTARLEPGHFFYLNNGLTAYCERLEVAPRDFDNYEHKTVRAYGLSIVNGAQTLGSVANALANVVAGATPGFVFMKVISLAGCDDDQLFAERITRSTNFQNQIGPRDFVALDEQQVRIAQHLRASGIHYHYKEGEDTPGPDANNFTLEEATAACATLFNPSDCDFCARLIANRRSLWSFDIEYPSTSLYRSRYAAIFRPDLSARTVWRAVQAARIVKEALRTTETGVRKDFFDNCRWLILHLVFLRLHPERGEDLTLTPVDVQNISTKAVEFAETVWAVCLTQRLVDVVPGGFQANRHFRSVFSSATDCQTLRNGAMAAINNPVASTIP